MITHLGPIARKELLELYNKCWAESRVPRQWKQAIIVPIPKPGKPPSQPSSHRPIALTCIPAKVLERMVTARLMWWLESNGKITDWQSGFRKFHQTMDQVIRLHQSIETGFQNQEETVAVLFDLKQAYDTVWHAGLLNKMELLGITGKMFLWIEELLKNRSISTRMGNSVKGPRIIENGLPQGSVISPVLFLIYINDLPNALPDDVQVALFADDAADRR